MALRPKPEAGDYLENGTRMVRVMGYTKSGDLEIEDALTEATEVLATSELGAWRTVRRSLGRVA